MKTGKLYICGTPIGNLDDVSIRLLKTLRKVDLIACEDTRMTIKLLNRFKIKTRMISYHEYSKREKEDYLIAQLLQGQNIALVSDAGMPTISDPGEELIRRALQTGIQLEVIPGPSALTAALALSGMDTSAFTFAGFLPQRRSRRREELEQLQSEQKTIILYEAPHRIRECLLDIVEIMGAERKLAIARELTKKHEEVRRGTAGELLHHFSSSPPRGEICLLIAPAEDKAAETNWELIIAETEELINLGIDKKEAFKIKAKDYGIKKNELYNYFIKKKRPGTQD
ncbi:16S rRNA (cytidine(1402)-2'-O)-methyltransferase [Syntrophomonas wolfei]|nr:16S rRNA (cytidine(1402)-2'-O)-methyltransferase [Syntrophomonas wolfei]